VKIYHRPFKGNWFYEWQIGPVVVQWKIDPTSNVVSSGLVIGRLSIWLDSYWRFS
jgi:hypothetical protein